MRTRALESGEKAVGYNPADGQCYTGEIIDREWIELARVAYWEYLLQTAEGETLQLPFWLVFIKDDVNGSELEMDYPNRFERTMNEWNLAKDEVVSTIVQALLAIE